MKKMLIAALFAVLSLGTNSFAYDDGYGNDDDYRSVRTVRNGAPPPAHHRSHGRQMQYPSFSVGGVLGVGFGGLRNVSGDFNQEYGTPLFDHWTGVQFNLGFAMSLNLLPFLSIAPEVSFGVRDYFRDVDHGYDYYRHVYYTAEENNYLFDIEIPLLFRVNLLPSFYIEAGPQFTFKLADDHTLEYKSDDYYEDDLGKRSAPGGWNFSNSLISLDVGLGGTMYAANRRIDVGLRLVLDLNDMEDHYYDRRDYEYIRHSARNEARMWMIQFIARWYAF